MHARTIAFTFVVTAAAGAVFLLVSPGDGRLPERDPLEPDLRTQDIAKWSPSLERGGRIDLVRRLCDSQKAEWLQTRGERAPELVAAGSLTTYGPLPERREHEMQRALANIAADAMKSAEEMRVETLADSREQMAQVLTAQKAAVAAAALADGHYWTIDTTAQPRLPKQHTYWRARLDDALGDGRTLDVFVPIDLSLAELAPTLEAVLALESDLRVDYAEQFNQMPFDERRALAEAAWSGARGTKIDRRIPGWFWKLKIDRLSWLATPLPAQS